MKGRWLALGLATLVALFFLAPGEKDLRGLQSSTYAAGPGGAKALYRFFDRLELPVVQWRGPGYDGLPDGTLWRLSRRPLSGLEAKALAPFVERGNTVVGSPDALEALLDREGFDDVHTTPNLDDDDVWRADELGHPKGQLASDDSRVLHVPAEPERVFAGQKSHTHAGPIIARWRAGVGGKGAIVLLGADDIVRNDEIGKADNGLVLLDIARGQTGPQIFDELETSESERGWLAWLAKLPYRFGVAQAALAVAVLLLGWFPRRFPIDPLPPATRRTTLEHLEAVARLWARTKDAGLPLEELLVATADRARRRGGQGDAPFLGWVAAVQPLLLERATLGWQRASALVASNPTARQAREAVGELMEIEREAAQW